MKFGKKGLIPGVGSPRIGKLRAFRLPSDYRFSHWYDGYTISSDRGGVQSFATLG